jgi:hypothetical protein
MQADDLNELPDGLSESVGLGHNDHGQEQRKEKRQGHI